MASFAFQAQEWNVRTNEVMVLRSRMFMRSVVSDDSRVGLLLFDEPSASLDPTAEHGTYLLSSHILPTAYSHLR